MSEMTAEERLELKVATLSERLNKTQDECNRLHRTLAEIRFIVGEEVTIQDTIDAIKESREDSKRLDWLFENCDLITLIGASFLCSREHIDRAIQSISN